MVKMNNNFPPKGKKLFCIKSCFFQIYCCCSYHEFYMEDLVINEVFHEGVEAACLMANLLEVVEC